MMVSKIVRRTHMYLALFLFPFALGQLATYRLTQRFGPLRPLALGALAYGLAFAALGRLPTAALAPWMILLGARAAVIFAHPGSPPLVTSEMKASAFGLQPRRFLRFRARPVVAPAMAERPARAPLCIAGAWRCRRPVVPRPRPPRDVSPSPSSRVAIGRGRSPAAPPLRSARRRSGAVLLAAISSTIAAAAPRQSGRSRHCR
jgi:hypothetical protein